MRASPGITFAVVGHNEEALLSNALDQVHEAATPGDPVWFVDSASTDGSAELARRLGARVVAAPLGKGRAVAAAVALCETSHICLIDGDLESTSRNAPATLRAALAETGADMVVAEFTWPAKPFRPVTTSIWRPLAGELFPEAVASVPLLPLSGFRILDVELARGPLPPGYGLEVHLDVVGSLDGRRTETVDIGMYSGPIRRNPGIAGEIATAILDVAECYGRLAVAARPAWDEWLAPVLQLIEDTDADDTVRQALLAEAASRPLPATAVAA